MCCKSGSVLVVYHVSVVLLWKLRYGSHYMFKQKKKSLPADTFSPPVFNLISYIYKLEKRRQGLNNDLNIVLKF